METFQETQTDLRWLAGKSDRGRRRKKERREEEEEEEEIDFGFGAFGNKDNAAELEKLKVVTRGVMEKREPENVCMYVLHVWMT